MTGKEIRHSNLHNRSVKRVKVGEVTNCNSALTETQDFGERGNI